MLDLGANDGRYARIAARHADYVVAVEQDPAVVDALYRALRAEGERRILPLVMDLADPSPGGGWRGVERAGFAERARADVVLALAVVHHLAIGRNVPLPEVVDQLAGLAGPAARWWWSSSTRRTRWLAGCSPTSPPGSSPTTGGTPSSGCWRRAAGSTAALELPSGTRTLYQAVVGG